MVGGGIAGLTTALAFAKAEASVRVFEQAKEIAEVGAGLQITPNGMRALLALGVDVAPRGVCATAVIPTDAVSGRPITRLDLRSQSPGYVFLHRADLIDALAEAAAEAGVSIHLGARVEQPLEKADLTVAADGIRSHFRPIVAGPEDPFFTGQVAWRAIVEHADDPVARIWMAPGRHVVTYPLTGGRLNVVAVEERETWAAEGWAHQDDPANLRAAFADCASELKDILTKVTDCHIWGLFRREIADAWHRGGTVLVGDAAHPTLPFLAQGANLAIEDGYVLARCCSEHGIEAGLAQYQALRKPRVDRAINAANANAVNYHLGGLRRVASHQVLRTIGTVAPRAFLGRLDWLYGHDVTA